MCLSLVASLKASAKQKDLYRGSRLHAEICSNGLLNKNPHLGNILVSMYAKCGALAQAREVLEELPIRNAITWSTLIAGYVQKGKGKEALGCFRCMRNEGLCPDSITYACLLKACAIIKEADMGKKIHHEIVNQGLLDGDLVLGNALVDMYAKCGVLSKAQRVLDELPVRDVISWSALIAGYAQKGQGEEALGCFRRMESEGLYPDPITYACILKACAITRELGMGIKIQDEIVSQGLLENNVVLGTALIDMYAKCGLLTKAQTVLDELSVRNVVSCSALIAGYVQEGQGEEAMHCFRRMQSEGIHPNSITYVTISQACGIMGQADMGKKFHDEIVSQGLSEKDVMLGTALVDMYAKCGALVKAQKVLEDLLVRNVVSWNALIAGYAQRGQGEEVMGCICRMLSEGLSPDAVTYACILKACGVLLDADTGKKVHDEIVSHGLLEDNPMLSTALVDMYAKCGILNKAEETLGEMHGRDVVSWNALIAGYTQHGHGQAALTSFRRMKSEGLSPNRVSWNALIGGYSLQGMAKGALECLHLMQREGTCPNEITFISVLNACSHSGLVDEGQIHFNSMTEVYGITPNKEHHACMVDLFGRARIFDKALRVIEKMPFSDYPPAWSAFLGSCRKWENVKLGKLAFEHAVQVDGCNSAVYVLMANVYAAADMQEDVHIIERMRSENRCLEAATV